MTDTIKITLPLPPASLHQHAKGNWHSKAKATKFARNSAYLEARALCDGVIWHAAVVDYMFYLPDRRRRDAANLVGAMKPSIDGILQTGLIPDDNWEMLAIGDVVCQVDRDRPRAALVFHRAEHALRSSPQKIPLN